MAKRRTKKKGFDWNQNLPFLIVLGVVVIFAFGYFAPTGQFVAPYNTSGGHYLFFIGPDTVAENTEFDVVFVFSGFIDLDTVGFDIVTNMTVINVTLDYDYSNNPANLSVTGAPSSWTANSSWPRATSLRHNVANDRVVVNIPGTPGFNVTGKYVMCDYNWKYKKGECGYGNTTPITIKLNSTSSAGTKAINLTNILFGDANGTQILRLSSISGNTSTYTIPNVLPVANITCISTDRWINGCGGGGAVGNVTWAPWNNTAQLYLNGTASDSDGTVSNQRWVLERLTNSSVVLNRTSSWGERGDTIASSISPYNALAYPGRFAVHFAVQDNDGDWSERFRSGWTRSRQYDITIGLGDVNGDSRLDSLDRVASELVAVGAYVCGNSWCTFDTNIDGVTNALDITATELEILRH